MSVELAIDFSLDETAMADLLDSPVGTRRKLGDVTVGRWVSRLFGTRTEYGVELDETQVEVVG